MGMRAFVELDIGQKLYLWLSLLDFSMKRIEVVAAIIHDDMGRIFATQRGYGEFKDYWEFPGGKMEPGATC